jgi:hypothetical protein
MSVRPFVHMKQLGSNWTDFHEIWYLSISQKICRENSSFIKIRKRIRSTLREDRCTSMIISRPVLARRNVKDKSCRKKIKTQPFVFKNFLRKSWRLWDVKKYCTAQQAGHRWQAHCMLDI